MSEFEKPHPQAEGLSARYWEGTKRGELVLQQCANCQIIRHYPQDLCSACYSNQYAWIVSPGIGMVHSWTVTHHAFQPGFRSETPYTLVTVDLAEGVRALGRWVLPRADNLSIGLHVTAAFVTRDDGFADLTWQPIS